MKAPEALHSSMFVTMYVFSHFPDSKVLYIAREKGILFYIVPSQYHYFIIALFTGDNLSDSWSSLLIN